MEEMNVTKKFPCSECSKAYSRLDTLRAHERDMHGTESNKKLVTCQHCCKSFGSRQKLLRHKATYHKHPGIPGHHCAVCGKEFSRTDNLREHEKSHEVEIECEDQHCMKVFQSHQAYNRHKNSHTDEVYASTTDTQCTACLRATKFKSDHQATKFKSDHQTIVIDQRENHQCTHCLKTFRECNKFQSHVWEEHTKTVRVPTDSFWISNGVTKRSYENERRYRHEHRKIGVRCDLCNQLFTTKHDCSRHQLLKHQSSSATQSCSTPSATATATSASSSSTTTKQHGHYVLREGGWKWEPLDPSVDRASLPTTDEKVLAYHQARINKSRQLAQPSVVWSSLASSSVVSSSVASSSVVSSSVVLTSVATTSAAEKEK